MTAGAVLLLSDRIKGTSTPVLGQPLRREESCRCHRRASVSADKGITPAAATIPNGVLASLAGCGTDPMTSSWKSCNHGSQQLIHPTRRNRTPPQRPARGQLLPRCRSFARQNGSADSCRSRTGTPPGVHRPRSSDSSLMPFSYHAMRAARRFEGPVRRPVPAWLETCYTVTHERHSDHSARRGS
jgi:hypothetical protein